MTDNAALGDMDTPARFCPEAPMSGELWKKVAAKRPGLGNPGTFFDKPGGNETGKALPLL